MKHHTNMEISEFDQQEDKADPKNKDYDIFIVSFHDITIPIIMIMTSKLSLIFILNIYRLFFTES